MNQPKITTKKQAWPQEMLQELQGQQEATKAELLEAGPWWFLVLGANLRMLKNCHSMFHDVLAELCHF